MSYKQIKTHHQYRVFGSFINRVCIATREDGKHSEPLKYDTILNLRGIGGFKTQVFASQVSYSFNKKA